jgi:hypothetical protein
MRSGFNIRFLILTLSIFICHHTNAAQSSTATRTAPDGSGPGPHLVANAEYKFPALMDPTVLSNVETELWARVHHVKKMPAEPMPVILMLHGNYATCQKEKPDNSWDQFDCQYTYQGVCPPGFQPVPSHNGFSYLAERLASWGFFVVSINANRGINCNGSEDEEDFHLNLARGRLILRHLQLLSEWNRSGGTPKGLGIALKGKLDLSKVGLLGHSRGGEGVRAAYNIYRESGSPWPARIVTPVSFRGIFEIAPVDGQTSRVLNADGTSWSALLPMCDGDVVDLDGIRPFDRMVKLTTESPATEKSTAAVWGANHNFFNTAWRLNDSFGCAGHKALFKESDTGSEKQRATAIALVVSFFRSNLRKLDVSFGHTFNPLYTVPASLSNLTRIDRGFIDTPDSSVSRTLEDFSGVSGFSNSKVKNLYNNVTVEHTNVLNHEWDMMAALITWKSAGEETYFESKWVEEGTTTDISSYKTLTFRVSRTHDTDDSSIVHPLNISKSTNFKIQLVDGSGSLSTPVQLKRYLSLRGPVGQGGPYPYLHPILQSVRIPLAHFSGIDLGQIRGVRFTFNDTPSGAINIAHIALSTRGISEVETEAQKKMLHAAELAPEEFSSSSVDPGRYPKVITEGNSIRVKHLFQSAGISTRLIEVELSSHTGFLPRNQILVLQIGSREFTGAFYPRNGNIRTLLFRIRDADFERLEEGATIELKYGRGKAPGVRWAFGTLTKSSIE